MYIMVYYYSVCIEFHIMIHISVFTRKYIAIIQCALLFCNVGLLYFFQLPLHQDHPFYLYILLLGYLAALHNCSDAAWHPEQVGKTTWTSSWGLLCMEKSIFSTSLVRDWESGREENPFLLLNLAIFMLCTG